MASGYDLLTRASMRAKTSEVPLAIDHYHEMEAIARLIRDLTLLNIALSYQGDMSADLKT